MLSAVLPSANTKSHRFPRPRATWVEEVTICKRKVTLRGHSHRQALFSRTVGRHPFHPQWSRGTKCPCGRETLCIEISAHTVPITPKPLDPNGTLKVLLFGRSPTQTPELFSQKKLDARPTSSAPLITHAHRRARPPDRVAAGRHWLDMFLRPYQPLSTKA